MGPAYTSDSSCRFSKPHVCGCDIGQIAYLVIALGAVGQLPKENECQFGHYDEIPTAGLCSVFLFTSFLAFYPAKDPTALRARRGTVSDQIYRCKMDNYCGDVGEHLQIRGVKASSRKPPRDPYTLRLPQVVVAVMHRDRLLSYCVRPWLFKNFVWWHIAWPSVTRERPSRVAIRGRCWWLAGWQPKLGDLPILHTSAIFDWPEAPPIFEST